MAIEYKWQLQIQNGGTTSFTETVDENKFGEGYTQVQDSGINSNMRSYDLEHVGQINDTFNNPRDVHAFLKDHYTKAFIFTPPHGEKGLFRVKADSLRYSAKSSKVGVVNATLVESVGVMA